MSFAQWLQHLRRHLSPDDGTASEQDAFLPVTALVVGICVLCTTWGPARAFTALRPVPILALLAVVLILVVGSRRLPGRANWRVWQPQWFLVGNFFIGLIAISFSAFSAMPGAAAFAGFFVLTTAVHGHVLRVTPKTPWFISVWVLQGALALVANHEPAHLVLWAIVVPAAIIAGTVLGTSALRADRRREEVASTRNALHAELLAHEEREAQILASRLREYLGVQHDLKTPLFVATLEIEHVMGALEAEGKPDVREAATNVHEALTRLSRLMTTAKAALDGREVNSAAVALSPALERTRAVIAKRFPSVVFEVSGADTPVAVLMNGGEETLLRVLENVCVNACEGSGTKGALHVVVHVLAVDESVVLHVDDDGPGFPPGMLGAVIPYTTTKSSGTGLGLFTVDRLVTASGGEMWRENRAGGGARVSCQLRRTSHLAPARAPVFATDDDIAAAASAREHVVEVSEGSPPVAHGAPSKH